MDKDKNFITAIILTILIIFFYPVLMKKMFPEQFKAQQTHGVSSQTSAQDADIIVDPVIPEVVSSKAEKTFVLSNNKYKLFINGPAAEIKQIELNDIIDPATEQATILINTENKTAGIFNTKELLRNAKLKNVEQSRDSIKFIYQNNDGLIINKEIYAQEDMYKLGMDISIENTSKNTQDVPYQVVTCSGLPKSEGITGRFNNIITIYNENKQFKKNPKSIKDKKIIPGDIKMGGMVARYFSLVVSPLNGADYFYTYNMDEDSNIYGIGKNNAVIEPGQTVRHKYVLYAGTNSHEQMAALNLEIESVRGKGFWVGLSDLLLLLLRWLFGIFKNYGIAVIGLALTVNLFLYPLTFKSLKSMKEMQALQPLVEKIRNDYKDNPDKLNREVMELYKKHKVNPAGGCLPMMLQMPVFFSLYGVLMRAIELRGARFLWIKDLSAPDALIIFSSKLPFIGNSFNLLPIVMVVLSFLQQKMTSGGQASEQQKAMLIMMPIFLGFIFYSFPSGLVLYFLTNSLFSFIVQMKLSKKLEAQLS